MKINNVEVKNEVLSIEEVGNVAFEKLEIAMKQVDDIVKDNLHICVSRGTEDNSFRGFYVFPNDIHEQAHWLDAQSDGYMWFSECYEAYTLDLSLHTVLITDITELTKKFNMLYMAYMNSVYNNCNESIQELGLLNEIYKIDEDTEHVFVRMEETVLECNSDMQVISTHGLDTKTNELYNEEKVGLYYEYKFDNERKHSNWVEVETTAFYEIKRSNKVEDEIAELEKAANDECTEEDYADVLRQYVDKNCIFATSVNVNDNKEYHIIYEADTSVILNKEWV